MDLAQVLLKKRLCGKEPPPELFGYDKQYSKLYNVIRKTIEQGQSNSILLMGPGGSGKTLLLRSVLTEIKENEKLKENLLEVHLNGLLQTDDQIAVKEITRQLQLENVVEDKVFGSFAENFQFLLETLKSGGKETKSVLFVLDKFDLFTEHKNQTLIYNLLHGHVCQSEMSPICVVGMTTNMDSAELLEKRVKSRFSNYVLHVSPCFTFAEYAHIFTTMLKLPKDFPDKRYASEWNKSVDVLQTEEVIQDILRQCYHCEVNVRDLMSLMFLPVCRVSEEYPYLKARDFVEVAQKRLLDSKSAILHGISVLELCLIISMKYLTEFYDGPFNFEMVFRDYQMFSQRRSSLQRYEKGVALKAFEHLCELELVCPAEGDSMMTPKEYKLMYLDVGSAQIMDALQRYPNCPTDVQQWAQSCIE